MSQKRGVENWILGHSKLAGFGTAIALATAFYPRISIVAGWICIAVAILFLIPILFGLAVQQDWRKVSLIISAVLVVVGLAGFRLLVTDRLSGTRAHLTVSRYEISPPVNGNPSYFTVFVRNDGAIGGEMKGGGSFYFLPGPLPRVNEQRDFEDKAFEAMLKQQPWKASPALRIGSKSEIYVSPMVLKTDAATTEKLQSGEIAILLLGRIVYSDRQGEHHTDYCLLTQNFQRPFMMCQQHNEAP
jgi:hypothetical protein